MRSTPVSVAPFEKLAASFDLVHIHTPFLAHYLGARYARRLRTPGIATAKLGTRSILQEGCGALIVAQDLEGFAPVAVRVLEDAQLRAALAREGRRYAREWSSSVMAGGGLAELYRSARRRVRQPPPVRAADAALTNSSS